MRKHHTSELSPRDRAIMEYGAVHSSLMFYFSRRHNHPFWGIAKESLRDARAARERIFRNCFDCEHCEIEAGYCFKPGEEPRELTWNYEEACTCEHYKERREVGHG